MAEEPIPPVKIKPHAKVEFDAQKRTATLNDTNSWTPESEKMAETKYGAGAVKICTALIICIPVHVTLRAQEEPPIVSQTCKGVKDIDVTEPFDGKLKMRAEKVALASN